MKNARLLFLICLLMGLSARLFSQNSGDTLYLKCNTLNELRFCQSGKTLSFKEVKQLCSNIPQAKEHIRAIQRIRWLRYPKAIVTGASLGLGLEILIRFPNGSIVSYLLFTSGILGVVNTIYEQKALYKEKAILVKLYNESK